MQSTAADELPLSRPCEGLPPELLGRVAAMCPNPADRARFRCVCCSWRLAVRQHCPQSTTSQPPCRGESRCTYWDSPLPPWVVLCDGSFLMLSDGERHLPSGILHYFGQPDAPYFCQPPDGGPHRLVTLPKGTTCVGSTDGWLALYRRHGRTDTFLLHNPFSNTTVPLPGVDAVCVKATALGEWFRVSKVLLLMRSSALAAAADDIALAVVVISQSRSYPFVLSLPGKGKDDAWTPEPHAPPFMHIIDVAFVGGDKLYGITRAEDFFCFHLGWVNNGVPPVVTRCERVIRHPLDCNYGGYFGYDEYYAPWSDDSSEEEDQEEEDEAEDQDQEVDYENDDDDEEEEEEDDDDDDDDDYPAERKLKVPSNVDVWFDKEDSREGEDSYVIVIRYLVESCGKEKKLIMVRRQLQSPHCLPTCTRKVEVFEADTEAGAWLPLPNGMGLGLAGDGGGQALFLSQRFSKCVSTLSSGYGGGGISKQAQQVDEDSIYFMDTGEAFDMKSGTISPRRWCLHYNDDTWVFPPGLVV